MSKAINSLKKVYFALGIEGVNPEDMKAKYLQAIKLLESKGFNVVNHHILESCNAEYKDSIEEIRQVVKDDLQALKRCDILLVDYSILNRNYVGA
ncbi:hypothetical protein KA005_66310, partial [bacterium]|nr:hypothetical protein [bacterium]